MPVCFNVLINCTVFAMIFIHTCSILMLFLSRLVLDDDCREYRRSNSTQCYNLPTQSRTQKVSLLNKVSLLKCQNKKVLSEVALRCIHRPNNNILSLWVCPIPILDNHSTLSSRCFFTSPSTETSNLQQCTVVKIRVVETIQILKSCQQFIILEVYEDFIVISSI